MPQTRRRESPSDDNVMRAGAGLGGLAGLPSQA